MESEEGRNRWRDGVPQSFDPTPPPDSSGGDEDFVKTLGLAMGWREQPRIPTRFHRAHSGFGFQLPAVSSEFCQQAVDDGLRAIRHGEHSSVRFGFESNPAGLKPLNGIPRSKSVECPPQLPRSPWVVRTKFRGIEAAMGHVAPATARDPNFLKRSRASLEHDYFAFCSEESRCSRSRKDPRCSSSDYGHAISHEARC